MTNCKIYDDMDYLSVEDWKEYLNEFEEMNGWRCELYEIAEIDFEDAMDNLKYALKDVKSFKAVGSFGLWYGRQEATTCEVDSLKELIIDLGHGFEDYYFTIKIEDNDLKLRYSHHDGINYFTIKECCIDENDKEDLKKLFDNREF